MLKVPKIFIGLAFLFLIFIDNTYSQKSIVFHDPDLTFKKGYELFNKQKYGAAQKYFNETVEYYRNSYSDVKTDAEYYSAICAIELFNKDAEYLISTFITKHPESPRVRTAYFQMGKFQYRKKEYQEAIHWFDKVNKYDLTKEEIAEFYFKMGYSYFVLENTEKASKLFYELIDGNTKYSPPAIYYYSHIAYNEKNYETALKGFNKLTEDETFAVVVPYYISQIYFFNKKYNKAIEFASDILENVSPKRTPEIARIIGESYCKLDKYAEAVPFLEIFKEKSNTYNREDVYQLAYAYYKSNDYENAAGTFALVTNVNDLLSQNAYYHLADCYLKLNDKDGARISFAAASKLDFDKEIKQDALFNYAKLTYELSYSPFNETINTFNEYIESYPNSKKIDEAYNFLVQVFMTSKNYKAALNSIEKITKKNNNILEAYQRIAFFRGLELFNNLEYDEAVVILDKSLNVPSFNLKIRALSLYWKAEANYRLGNYNKAINNYDDFLVTPGAYSLPEYNDTYYNLGYCYFKKKDYKASSSWFRKYVDNVKDTVKTKIGDANNRIADCYFINTDYRNAIKYYANAVEIKTIDYDYALFQKGFSYGLIKNHKQKIIILSDLLNDTNSTYFDDALFEIAKSYVVLDSANLAISNYELILSKYPNSSYIKKSLVQLALLNYNQNNNDEALKLYQRVIEDYPGTNEAKDALIGIKNIYIDLNDVDTYFDYVNSLGGFADVSIAEQDSMTYLTAEKVYMTGDCNKTIELLDNYLKKFSDGRFVLNASFYKAECYFNNKENEKALKLYNLIINKPKNTFTEQALLKAAEIYYLSENYEDALEKYTMLENVAELKTNLLQARIGQLRCTYFINSYKHVIEAADKLLITRKIPDEIKREAIYKKAKALYSMNKLELALIEFRILAQDSKNKEGAEAKYMICKILFEQKKYELAQQEVFDFVNLNTPFQFWLAKSYILLAEMYITNNNNFQAKATLQSIIENYENKDDGIINEANEKLSIVIRLENAKFEPKQEKDIEINFDDNKDGKYDELFDDNDENKNINED
ncbi:MAG: tetratricopeptide repeat protein [Bacteroidales bacterium]|nr:tetratricopeptide repeat protein [Bacteroidales bacterium]